MIQKSAIMFEKPKINLQLSKKTIKSKPNPTVPCKKKEKESEKHIKSNQTNKQINKKQQEKTESWENKKKEAEFKDQRTERQGKSIAENLSIAEKGASMKELRE